MFEVEQFIEQCREALKESQPKAAARDVVARAVAEPGQLLSALGEPELAGLNTIYHADDLTILNIVWGADMTLHPHDHNMWAAIGIYIGQEDNTFYRRSPEGLQQHGLKTLYAKETIPLGEDIIHSVHNPLGKLTAALHVYGGDFFAAERHEWDPQTFDEHPFDIAHTRQVFDESNEKLLAATR